MKRPFCAGLAGMSCLALMTVPAFARAMMIAPAPIAQRVALADAVVVGKVTGFGDKLVSARPPFGGDKVDYQIAIVQVNDPITGVKGAKEIKVGFLPPPPPPPPPAPGPGPFLLVKRYPQFTLALDQEACLFLVKHPTEDFYIGQNYYDVINKNNPGFDKDMDEVKRCARLLADPSESLKAKSGDDRFLTSAMLITRYRTQKPGSAGKTEPIDAEQSKLILQALADADWNPKVGPAGPAFFQLNPQGVFFRLGISEKDGWIQPKDAAAIPDAAKKWLRDNADMYRLERYVADKKEEK